MEAAYCRIFQKFIKLVYHKKEGITTSESVSSGANRRFGAGRRPFISTSHSTFTYPACLPPRIVASGVRNEINADAPPATSTTVRLTPSTATEPLRTTYLRRAAGRAIRYSRFPGPPLARITLRRPHGRDKMAPRRSPASAPAPDDSSPIWPSQNRRLQRLRHHLKRELFPSWRPRSGTPRSPRRCRRYAHPRRPYRPYLQYSDAPLSPDRRHPPFSSMMP